jgi:hypothetical protein
MEIVCWFSTFRGTTPPPPHHYTTSPHSSWITFENGNCVLVFYIPCHRTATAPPPRHRIATMPLPRRNRAATASPPHRHRTTPTIHNFTPIILDQFRKRDILC